MAEIYVNIPLKNVIELNKINNLEVNKKYKNKTIKNIRLYSSYKTPGTAVLHISAIDDKNTYFTKNFDMEYTVESVDNDLNIAFLKLNFINRHNDEWYILDSNLAKEIMSYPYYIPNTNNNLHTLE